jgi:hypothetical protein
MANLSGSWLGTYWQYGNPTRFEMTLVQGGNTLTGNILDNSYLGEAIVTGELIGRKVTFTKRYIGNNHYFINYRGIVSEDEQLIQGQWNINGDKGKWVARRQDDNLSLNLKITRQDKVPVSV